MLHRSFLPLLLFSFAGCSHLFSAAEPETLDPFAVEASVNATYDAAVALAFEEGYDVLFASDTEYLIQLERPLFYRWNGSLKRVQRLDVLLQEAEGQTVIRARYHSIDPASDGTSRRVVKDDDREAARAFVSALERRTADA